MDIASFLSEVKDFFREDTGEVLGAYFDGEKIFLTRATETFKPVEIAAKGADFERLAEKISAACLQYDLKNFVGLCLRDKDVVTFKTDASNVPEREFPALVESWSRAQSGEGSLSSFVRVGSELWMETLPKSKADEICATFRKRGLNLIALSIMPPDLLTKKSPLDKARFIAEVATKKISPNLLPTREGSWNLKHISLTLAAIFLIAASVHTTKIFSEWLTTSNELDAAKTSLDEQRDDLSIKKFIDDDTDELIRLNNLTADFNATNTFNLLINLGKSFGGNVRLTKIRVDENFTQVDGLAKSTEILKSCLARVKNSVTQSARLENSTARDDGEIVFAISADLQEI